MPTCCLWPGPLHRHTWVTSVCHLCHLSHLCDPKPHLLLMARPPVRGHLCQLCHSCTPKPYLLLVSRQPMREHTCHTWGTPVCHLCHLRSPGTPANPPQNSPGTPQGPPNCPGTPWGPPKPSQIPPGDPWGTSGTPQNPPKSPHSRVAVQQQHGQAPDPPGQDPLQVPAEPRQVQRALHQESDTGTAWGDRDSVISVTYSLWQPETPPLHQQGDT